jgi:hypothetical protein
LVRSFFPVFPACPRRHVNHLFVPPFLDCRTPSGGFLPGHIRDK